MVAPLTLALYALSRRTKAVRESDRLQAQIEREDEQADRAYQREIDLIKLRVDAQEKSATRLAEAAQKRELALLDRKAEDARRLGVIGYDLREGLDGNNQGLVYYDANIHDFNLFDKKYLQFGNNNPEAVADVPDYKPFFYSKTGGSPVLESDVPEGQKGDYIFAGYMVPGRPDLVQNIPNPVLKAQFDKGNVKVDPVKTEDRIIKAFDENGEVQTFPNEQAAAKHMAKPDVQAWYEANDLNPIYTIETTTTTKKGDVETEKNFKTERVAPLVSAANRVNKEETPTVAFALTPNIINNKEVARPDVSLFSTSDTAGEDLSKFDRALAEAGLTSAAAAEKMFKDMERGGAYSQSLRSLAGYIVQKESFITDTGGIGINAILKRDPENYLAGYGAIRFMPGIVEALNQATLSSAVGPIMALKERVQDDTGTTDSLVGHYSLSEEQDMARNPRDEFGNLQYDTGMPPKQTISIISQLPEEYRVLAREFQQQIAESSAGLLAKLYPEAPDAMSAAETYVQDNLITYVPNTGLQQVADEQPVAEFISYLKNTRVGGSPDGETFFSVFRRTLDGTSTVYSPVEQEVLKRFIADEGLSFDQKINLMMVMTTHQTGSGASSTTYQGVINDFALDPEVSYDDFKEEKQAVATAYGNAEQMLTAFIATFYDREGNLLPLGTKASTVALALDGVVYYYDAFVKPLVQKALGTNEDPFAPVKEITDRDQAVAEMKKSLFGSRSKFSTFLDSATEAERRAEAKRRGMSYDSFIQKEASARAELEKMFNDTTLLGDENTNLQYALRGYYRFMTAYSLASAVQGGTGGRTISDQDVLNFLKAFNTDRYLSRPETEVGVLRRVLDSVQYQRKIASNIAQRGAIGERTARATMKFMTFPGANVNLSMMQLATKVGVDIRGGGADSPDEKPKEDEATTPTGYTQEDIDAVVADQAANAFTKGLNVSTPFGTVRTMDELIELNPGLDYDAINRILGRK